MNQAPEKTDLSSSAPWRLCARRSALRMLRWARNGFAIIGFAFVAFKLCFELTVVVSESMSPTLQGSSYETGDWVLTEKITYRFRDPRRWEVIACRQNDGTRVMKRVAGLPGEVVSMRKHTVLIDGKPARRPPELAHIEYLACGNIHRGRVAPCGDGFYVLGDSSWDSNDSRFEGPVARERVRGRPLAIVWPPSRVGWID